MYKSSKEMVYTDLLDFNTKKKIFFFQLQEFFSRQSTSVWFEDPTPLPSPMCNI